MKERRTSHSSLYCYFGRNPEIQSPFLSSLTHEGNREEEEAKTKEDNIIWDEAGKSIVRTGIKREKTKVRS